jgi:hypothetical protein
MISGTNPVLSSADPCTMVLGSGSPHSSLSIIGALPTLTFRLEDDLRVHLASSSGGEVVGELEIIENRYM